MSIHRVHLRKRTGKLAPHNILLPFRITHTHKHNKKKTHHFALEPTQAHIHAHPKIISGGIFQRFIPSSETKLNDDTVCESATLSLTLRVLEPYILDIHNGQFYLLFSPVADE